MLKTNYKDDIPATTKRKYQMIDNGDGTVSFNDMTTYTQTGDTFGATDMNATNTAVNQNATDISGVSSDLTTAVNNINTALNNKEDKVTYDTNSYNSVAVSSIQSVFDKFMSEMSSFASILAEGTQIQISPFRYTWTEGSATCRQEAYWLKCVGIGTEYITQSSKQLYYRTAIFQGVGLGQSIELAYSYRWIMDSGFPSASSYPNQVKYFKDFSGTDLSTNAKYIGDGYADIKVKYKHIS